MSKRGIRKRRHREDFGADPKRNDFNRDLTFKCLVVAGQNINSIAHMPRLDAVRLRAAWMDGRLYGRGVP